MQEPERRMVAARAILGNGSAGQGAAGRTQAACGRALKADRGVAAQPGGVEIGVSLRLPPAPDTALGTDRVPQRRARGCKSRSCSCTGERPVMSGPILETVTEKYLLRSGVEVGRAPQGPVQPWTRSSASSPRGDCGAWDAAHLQFLRAPPDHNPAGL